MYNITLVCTHHSDIGNCSADELYKIIESIGPDIIFEELPQDLFERVYNQPNIPFDMPEIEAVKRYIKNYKISHVPVDIPLSYAQLDRETKNMFNLFTKYHAHSKLEADQKKMIFEEGYAFLNSHRNEEFCEEKKLLEKRLIEWQTNKNRLSRIHTSFYEEQHSREHEILKNIYNYSENVAYNQGLLLLGAGHRKTIVEKIGGYASDNHIELKWIIYGS